LPFLQSLAQQNLAREPQPADNSHGLLFPSAHAGFGDPLTAGVPSPLRSACRVWLPSARLSPAESGPALFHAGSARGICPSERSPSARSSERFRPIRTHMPFRTVGKRPARSGGPARRAAASGVCPAPESLTTGRCLVRRPLVAPLGFSLTGFARHRLGRVLPGLLSHALRMRLFAELRPPAPQSLAQR
jgi:hypothetical protein